MKKYKWYVIIENGKPVERSEDETYMQLRMGILKEAHPENKYMIESMTDYGLRRAGWTDN